MSKYYIVSTVFLGLLLSSLIVDGRVDIPLGWYIMLVTVYLIISASVSASSFATMVELCRSNVGR